MKTTNALLFALVIAFAGACNTDIGELSCQTTNNGENCYFPSQYLCLIDPITGDTNLAAVGTDSCNNNLYATCAYSCNLTTGQIELRADRTCPAPPSCSETEIGCGEACYDADKVCCINSAPVVLQQCPPTTPALCDNNNSCNFTFSGVGQLADGQLRQNFGPGSFEVSFSLIDGSLFDNHGQICYVTSPENQVQCNTNAQFDTTDSFCLAETEAGQFLSYEQSTQFYACAVGTGGYNIYTSQYNGAYCQPIFIEVDSQTCPEVPTTSSAPTTSSTEAPATTSSTEAPATTSSTEAPATTSSTEAPATTSSTEAPATTSSTEAPATTSSTEAPATTSSTEAPATTSSVPPSNFPTTSSAAPTTSSAAPTTSSAAPTTSSAAPTTSSAAPTTSSTKAPAPTTSSAPSTISNVPHIPTTSRAHTTSAPSNTCVNKPRPVPWCYFDFDLDFDADFSSKSKCSDRSGKGHHGKFFGSPKGASSHWKYGASFSGKGQQYISINQTNNLSNTFTVATYVKFDSLGQVTIAESNTWSVKVDAKEGKIYFVGKETLTFDAVFASGVWIHIAVSIDVSGNVVAYKDGQACGKTKKTSCQKHNGPVNVCKHKGSFHGSFDEYFIFNYTLTFTEVETCRNKHQDECATVTTHAPVKTTKATPTTSKAAPPTKATTSKAAPPTKASHTTKAPCDEPTTSKAVPTTKASTQAAKTTSKAAPPATTEKKKHNCGVPWVYFPCDQNHHSKCSDESGHGNHGSWSGPTPSQCGGKVRNGVTFAGTTTQAITVSKCPLAADFSVATWIRFQVSGSSSYKVCSTKSADGASAGWELEFNAITKTAHFHGAGNSKASWDCSELSANSWFHLSVVVSGSSKCELFVNGNSKGLKSVDKISTGGALNIANSASKNAQLKGSIDEFCIFDKALTAEQVAFARDTYTDQAQTSSWSGHVSADWGAAWEKSSLTTLKLNRIEKWWQL